MNLLFLVAGLIWFRIWVVRRRQIKCPWCHRWQSLPKPDTAGQCRCGAAIAVVGGTRNLREEDKGFELVHSLLGEDIEPQLVSPTKSCPPLIWARAKKPTGAVPTVAP